MKRRTIARVIAVVLLAYGGGFLLACAAKAQVTAPDSGTRIRVVSSDRRQERGILLSLTSDTLIFRPELTTAIDTMSLARVRSIEMSLGKRLSARNIILGAGIGTLVGLGTAVALTSGKTSGDGPPPGIALPIVASLLAGAGLVIGAYIGGRHPVEKWSPVYQAARDVGLLVTPSRGGGLNIGFSIRE